MRKILLLIAIALLLPFEAVAQDLSPRLREAPTSVGDVRRVTIEGGPAWLFELGPDRRERGRAGDSLRGRQRIELRDQNVARSGTYRYSMEFAMRPMDDPDGRFARQIAIFQLKPGQGRGARDYSPYLLIDIPEDYRREGLIVNFDFNYGNRTEQVGPPMNPFAWNTIEVEVNWSNGPDGYARVSHNGRQIASYSGFTGPDAAPGLANFGLYRSNLEAVEQRGDQIEDLQFLVRNYRMTKLN